jgi:hypothetical protein
MARWPHARSRYVMAFCICSPLLLCHTPRAPTPQVLQWWLYQPCQQTQCWQGPSAMASAVPMTGSTPPHLCMSTPWGLTPFASMSTFTTVSASPRGSEDIGDKGALATADDAPLPADILVGPVSPTLLFTPQHSPRMGKLFSGCASAGVVSPVHPHLSPSCIAIASPHLNNTTSRNPTMVCGHQH